MKYVIIQDAKTGTEYPILFPDSLVHKDVAMYMLSNLNNNHSVAIEDCRISSAGFINSIDLNVEPTGNSESLGIGAKYDDKAFIQTLDYNGGRRDCCETILMALDSAKEKDNG